MKKIMDDVTHTEEIDPLSPRLTSTEAAESVGEGGRSVKEGLREVSGGKKRGRRRRRYVLNGIGLKINGFVKRGNLQDIARRGGGRGRRRGEEGRASNVEGGGCEVSVDDVSVVKILH